jgi:hypothetical protein
MKRIEGKDSLCVNKGGSTNPLIYSSVTMKNGKLMSGFYFYQLMLTRYIFLIRGVNLNSD